jgi:hypothetical protein
MVQLELSAPMCAECSARENKIGNVTWIPFFGVGLLVFLLAFIPAGLISPDGTTPQTYAFPFLFGTFIGMIAGIVVGSLVEFGLRIFFAPSYGKLLLKRPLTVFSVFNDSEDLIGLSTRFADSRKTLRLIFENDEIGKEFATLNQSV